MSETATMTLTQFLAARLDEDEAAAREPWIPMLTDVQAWWDEGEDEPGFFADDQPDDVKGLAKTLLQIQRRCGHYDRALAEVEAKRRALDALLPHRYDSPAGRMAVDHTLRAIAAIYRDHPDYDPTWAPTEAGATVSETPSTENGERLCPSCGHIPREGFGCAGRPTPSDIWAGVYPGDCDCECPIPPGTGDTPETRV